MDWACTGDNPSVGSLTCENGTARQIDRQLGGSMSTMGSASFGDLLRTRRIELGFTQQELADRSGLSVRTVGNIEQGRLTATRSASLDRLSQVLGLAEPGRPAVSISLLGPLVVQPVDLAALKQRSLLALLALHHGTVVSRDEIADVLWDEQPPTSWPSLVHTYVARLRKVLPDRAIAAAHNGYLLCVQDIELDLVEFDDRVAQAHRLRRDGDPDTAEKEFAAALGLWRGRVLADLPDRLRTSPTSTALTTRRLSAALAHADVACDLGRYDQAVTSLRALADAEPLHEGLHARLMLALTGSGNQSAALLLFQEIRDRLDEELGVVPGAELQQAHQDVLRQDVRPARTRATTPIPRQLPPRPRWFTGRERELAALDTAVDTGAGGAVVISALAGSGGIGKTWLALHWAHRNADRFPDGQLFVDLRGFAPDGQPLPATVAVRGFLDAFGVEASRIPQDLDAQVALYRSLIAERRMMVVLDNAADTAQVTPLLPGTSTCTVLVTSRDRLPGLIASHGARPLTVDVLSDPQAHDLLAARLGAARLAAESASVDELVAWCGGIPLALSIVAGRAEAFPDVPLAELAGQLRDAASRLGVLDEGDPAASLPAVLSWSYAALSTELAEVFGLLGSVPGPDISLPAAASLTGLPVDRAEADLRALRRVSLISEHAPGRWRMHDLVGLYATQRAGEDLSVEAIEAALRRLVDFYLHSAHHADRLTAPSRRLQVLGPPAEGCTPETVRDNASASAWVATEMHCLTAANQLAFDRGWDLKVVQLTKTMVMFHRWSCLLQESIAMCALGLAASLRMGDLHLQSNNHTLLGQAYRHAGQWDRSFAHLRQGLALAERIDDAAGQADITHAISALCSARGDYEGALANATRALRTYQELDESPKLQARLHNTIGWTHALLEQYDQAREFCETALRINQEHDDPDGEANVSDSLGYIAHHTGRYAEALDYYGRALAMFQALGNAYQAADAHLAVGDIHAALGDDARARSAWELAFEHYQAQQRPDEARNVRERLTTACPG
jgi:DNA-binding SARP family transcriptional activator/DNA-binding XRE family transcriptional regulator